MDALPPTNILTILPQTRHLVYSYTIIRDSQTVRKDFVFHSNRIIANLVEAALDKLDYKPISVITPTNAPFDGIKPQGKLCGVSIVRAGDSMVRVLRDIVPSIRIGKILIQRDETTALPKLFYSKLPGRMNERTVLLLDPMLATGGSVIMAIKVLIEQGVEESKIIFVNLVSCPEGIRNLQKAYPLVNLITGCVDSHLDKRAYIIPGLGDFGDRYFGSD